MNVEDRSMYDLLSEKEIEIFVQSCCRTILQSRVGKTIQELQDAKLNLKREMMRHYKWFGKSNEEIEQIGNLIENVCSKLIYKKEQGEPLPRFGKLVKEMLEDLEEPIINESGLMPIVNPFNSVPNRNMREELKVDVSNFNNPNVNFTELNRPELLSSAKDANKYKNWESKDVETYEFVWNSETIRVKNVGIMKYTTAVGVEEYLNEYQVDRYDENGNLTYSDKVFTYLVMQRLSRDKNYRDIVFEKLLSPQNIHAKDSKGYVGEIATISAQDKKYGIEYVPESYTAVVKLKKALEERGSEGR